MTTRKPKPPTLHITLTPPIAAALARLARERGQSERQIARDALAALVAQQPTAATVATTIDAAMDRAAARLQSATLDAVASHANENRAANRADIQSLAAMLLSHLAPGVEIVGAPGTPPPAQRPRSTPTPLRSLAELAAQQARGG